MTANRWVRQTVTAQKERKGEEVTGKGEEAHAHGGTAADATSKEGTVAAVDRI